MEYKAVNCLSRLVAVEYMGHNSLKDFGVTVSSYKIGDAEPYEARASVPFMSGDYDFSCVNGKTAYKNRSVTVVFNVIAPTYNDADLIRSDIVSWLSYRGGDLRITDLPGRHFMNTSCKISANSFARKHRHTWELTAIFTVYPYMIEDNTRPAYYTATAQLTAYTYELSVADKYVPYFSTTAACTVRFEGVDYSIPANSQRYRISDIVFERGVNLFSLMGSGELTIETFKEVL